MKNQKSLIITLVVMVVVIAGAALLYNMLGDRFNADNLVVDAPTESTAAPTAMPSDETPPGPDATESDATGNDATETNTPDTDTPSEDASSDGEETEPPKVEAPNFAMQDSQGGSVSLEDFRGKPVVLNFWASWCPPCREEMPDFDGAFGDRGEDVHFVMVNLTGSQGETMEKGQAFVDDNGYRFPVYFDVSQEGAMRYAIRSVPTTYFIDAEGYVVAHASGMINRSVLDQGLSLITD